MRWASILLLLALAAAWAVPVRIEVNDLDTLSPLSGATVDGIATDDLGVVELTTEPGKREFLVASIGHQPQTARFNIRDYGDNSYAVYLEEAPNALPVRISVAEEYSVEPVEGARIQTEGMAAEADADGIAALRLLCGQSYDLNVSAEWFTTKTQSVRVYCGVTNEATVFIKRERSQVRVKVTERGQPSIATLVRLGGSTEPTDWNGEAEFEAGCGDYYLTYPLMVQEHRETIEVFCQRENVVKIELEETTASKLDVGWLDSLLRWVRGLFGLTNT